jgi:hypothetical protein
MMSSSVSERNRDCQSRLVSDDARRVSLSREVLGQRHVPRTVAVQGAVGEPDLDLAGERDDELPARGVVPVGEVAGLCRPEDDALGVASSGWVVRSISSMCVRPSLV